MLKRQTHFIIYVNKLFSFTQISIIRQNTTKSIFLLIKMQYAHTFTENKLLMWMVYGAK